MSRKGVRNGGRQTQRSVGTRVTASTQSTFDGSVVWWGPFLNGSGYGEQARGFLRGLTRRGVHVAARSTGIESSNYMELLQDNPDLAISLRESLNRPVGPGPVTAVVHGSGHLLRRISDADFTVGRTMFETDGLPDDWVRRINMLDDVWVPSAFNAETFRSAGVTIPIGVVPSGVDGSAYRPGLKQLPIPGAKGCVFPLFPTGVTAGPQTYSCEPGQRPSVPMTTCLSSYSSMGAVDSTKLTALVSWKTNGMRATDYWHQVEWQPRLHGRRQQSPCRNRGPGIHRRIWGAHLELGGPSQTQLLRIGMTELGVVTKREVTSHGAGLT